jgi:hypothetical protein
VDSHGRRKLARSGKRRRDRGPPTHAFTVDEFCDAHRISKARYYELKLEGLAPDEMIVGRRRIISHEAADVPSGFDLSPPRARARERHRHWSWWIA